MGNVPTLHLIVSSAHDDSSHFRTFSARHNTRIPRHQTYKVHNPSLRASSKLV